MQELQSSVFKAKVLATVLGLSLVGSFAKAEVTLGAPEWSGDFRFRGESVTGGRAADILRERMQARLVSKWAINDTTSFRLGLATGSGDGRSTNQTLGSQAGAFADYTPVFNLAELTYKANPELTVKMGKMNTPLFTASELEWDKDLNFDGIGFQWGSEAKSGWGFGVNGGIFSLNSWENGGSTGAKLYSLQPVVTYSAVDYNAKLGLRYDRFESVAGRAAMGSSGTVTSGRSNALSGGFYVNNYQPWVLDATSTMKNFWGLPVTTWYTTGIINSVAADNLRNQGILLGVRVGSAKVQTMGDWQVDLNYRNLQSDAVLDIFPESDFVSGWTGVSGTKLSFTYGIASRTSFTLTGIFAHVLDQATSAAGANETTVQADLKFDF